MVWRAQRNDVLVVLERVEWLGNRSYIFTGVDPADTSLWMFFGSGYGRYSKALVLMVMLYTLYGIFSRSLLE